MNELTVFPGIITILYQFYLFILGQSIQLLPNSFIIIIFKSPHYIFFCKNVRQLTET